jgi:gamma-glutamylputrescine oxidase
MISYWEQASLLSYDHIVVGAGIVGLNTAIGLRKRFPNERVLVLERSLLPFGASSRNAGFACMGSVTELLDDLQHSSESEVVQLFARRKKGLEQLRQLLGDEAIGYQQSGSYELISTTEVAAMDQIQYLNQLLQPVTEGKAFVDASEKIAGFGFNPDYTRALIENLLEGSLHTGKMMRRLTDFAILSGVEIKTGAIVERFEPGAGGVDIPLKDASRKESIRLHCRNLFICTNAFTDVLLPGADVQPGRGQVLITDPIPGLRIKGIFHFDRGYYYFRELEGRILFGGGRQLDFEGETTTDIDLNAQIQFDLERKLKDLILPGVTCTISRRWSGIMGFARTKSPVIGKFGPHTYAAFSMGGMGVALGSCVASELLEAIEE